MAKAPKETTFSSRSNAKRAAEKAIADGTAPSIDYGIKERPSGRFEISWHRKGGTEEVPTTEWVEEEIATSTAEFVGPNLAYRRGFGIGVGLAREFEAAEAENPLGYRDRLLAADAARRQKMAGPVETEADLATAEEERESDDAAEAPAEPITTPSDGEGDMPDRFPPGTQVIVQVGKRKRSLGVVDYRVDARHVRVHLTAAAPRTPSAMFEFRNLTLATDEEWASWTPDMSTIAPAAKPERKPRAAPSGDRKPSKNTQLDAMAARGEMPAKPIITSKANQLQYQKRFDQLEKSALAGDWDAVLNFHVKGINSYAKMLKQYRDRLLAAHAASAASDVAA